MSISRLASSIYTNTSYNCKAANSNNNSSTSTASTTDTTSSSSSTSTSTKTLADYLEDSSDSIGATTLASCLSASDSIYSVLTYGVTGQVTSILNQIESNGSTDSSSSSTSSSSTTSTSSTTSAWIEYIYGYCK